MNLPQLQVAIHANAKKKGFWNHPLNYAEKLALVHSEVSEALEELRKNEPDQHKFGEELADVVIRVLDIAEAFNIDLGSFIEMKHRKNLMRPFKHGKQF